MTVTPLIREFSYMGVRLPAFVYRLGCSVAYSEASVSKHTDAYSSRARRLGRPSLSVPGGDQIAA